jgi:hypothetical protein
MGFIMTSPDQSFDAVYVLVVHESHAAVHKLKMGCFGEEVDMVTKFFFHVDSKLLSPSTALSAKRHK